MILYVGMHDPKSTYKENINVPARTNLRPKGIHIDNTISRYTGIHESYCTKFVICLFVYLSYYEGRTHAPKFRLLRQTGRHRYGIQTQN